VLVLYDGRQIYFGRCGDAKVYFINLGFECPDRQTTADFLTSMTSHLERVVQPGFEARFPGHPMSSRRLGRIARTSSSHQGTRGLQPAVCSWRRTSPEFQRFPKSSTIETSASRESLYFVICRSSQTLPSSRFWRLKGDPSLTLTQLFGNFIMALIISSIFYNLQPNTDSFFSRSALLFFAILLNAFGSALEVRTIN